MIPQQAIPQQLQREAVVREARTWIGTPYHHHARIKGVGVDCAQLLCAVYEACGLIPHVDTGAYAVDWHMNRNEEMFSAWLSLFAHPGQGGLDNVRVGDVCLWRFGRTFSHGSIYVGEGLLVHAYINMGVIVSRASEEPLDGHVMQHWSLWK